MLREILSLNSREYTRVIPALFAYYFGRIDQDTFIKYVGDRKEGTRIKDIARKNGYILMNCKLYAYAVHYCRHHNLPKPKYSEYGVHKSDAALLSRLNLKHIDPKYEAYTVDSFNKLVTSMLQSSEIKTNIGKFVSKKMMFLIKSYGDTRHDINAFLQEQALIAVYITYPAYESYLHLVNIGKAAIHNKGQSYISSSTSKSRQRLSRTPDGLFESVVVDVSTLAELEAPPNYGEELREGLQALASIEAKLPVRTKEFLLAASGQFHSGFSQTLGLDNSDAVEHMDYNHYLSQLRNHFEVSESKMLKLFSNLRNHIYRCNNDRSISA